MLDYLQKFDELATELKIKVSSATVLSKIEQLEKDYKIDLAPVIIKIMVKELSFDNLISYFLKQGLEASQAEKLVKELKEKIFATVLDYLTSPLTTMKVSPPLSSKPTVSQDRLVQGASFFFSAEDEEEIRELAKKFETEKISQEKPEQIEERLNNILRQTQINFGSQLLAERFKQIIKIYLRGIRNRLETKQSLIKPFESGGLSFDEQSAEKVLAIAEKDLEQPTIKQKMEETKAKNLEKEKLTELRKVGVRDIDYDLAGLTKKSTIRTGELDTKHELSLPPIAVTSGKFKQPDRIASDQAVKETKVKPELTQPATIKAEVIKPSVRRSKDIELTSGSKVKVEDVKYVPKIMGPIDELKFMDLVNFRRLDKDSRQATDKIKEIIDLLEEENYAKRLEGIKAWRISPVNKLYLEMGEQSIKENKPIELIIEERKTKQENYLTNEEFKAIMDLNKNLRF